MANEISIKASLAAKKGHFKFPLIGVETVKIDQAGFGGGAPGIVDVGPADEEIDLSALDDPGQCWLKNIDAVQHIRYGPNNGGSMVPLAILGPGEVALMKLDSGVGLRAQVVSETEESESTSAENRAKLHIVVMER